MPWLKLLEPGHTDPRLVPLDGDRCNIGRDADNDLVLADPAASRRHARLTRSASGWSIEDCGSGNGTFVNRERVQSAALSHGDRVRLGRCVLHFEDPPTVGLPPPAPDPVGGGRLKPLLVPAIALLLLGAGLGAWGLHRRARRSVAGPPVPPTPAGVPADLARPSAAPEAPTQILDLQLRLTVQYDQAFDGGDQEWLAEQELTLEARGLTLVPTEGGFKALRQGREGTDRVEACLEGNRLSGLRWSAYRRVARTLEGGREETARDERWEFRLDTTLGPPQDHEGRRHWRLDPGAAGHPVFTHQLTFHPQQASVTLTKADWAAGSEREAEAPFSLTLRPMPGTRGRKSAAPES